MFRVQNKPAFMVKIIAVSLVIGFAILTTNAITTADASAPMVVNSTADSPDSDPTDGVCKSANNTCTLRAAIQQANNNDGPNQILFDVPGSSTHTIKLLTPLPDINDSRGGVTIDGYSQPGARENTSPSSSNAIIKIEVQASGTLAQSEHNIHIKSSDNIIRGLSLSGAKHNLRISGENTDNNQIVGNFIGPSTDGKYVNGAAFGILVELGPDRNFIGTPALADRNVISGNGLQGIRINHGETSENIIQNNIIGLTPDMGARLPQRFGIDMQWWTWGNLVGGLGQNEKNIISGNGIPTATSEGGVDLSHSSTDNFIVGNYFGTLFDGKTTTEYSKNSNGIVIKDNASENYIGQNIIGNNHYNGIWHKHNYTGPNTFVENRIGISQDGTLLPNGQYGILLTGHDMLHIDNIIAGSQGGVDIFIDDISIPITDGNTNFEPEKTLGNKITQTAFIGGSVPIDIAPLGTNRNDTGDTDDGAHLMLNGPSVTGSGPGAIRGSTCSLCSVETYLQIGDERQWIATSKADTDGNFSLKSDQLVQNITFYTVAIDQNGNTSEMAAGKRIPAVARGVNGQEDVSLGRTTAVRPELPNYKPLGSGPVTPTQPVDPVEPETPEPVVDKYLDYYAYADMVLTMVKKITTGEADTIDQTQDIIQDNNAGDTAPPEQNPQSQI